MQIVRWQMNYKFLLSKAIESDYHISDYLKSFCKEHNTVRDNAYDYTGFMTTDYEDFIIIKLTHPDAVYRVNEVTTS
jgi:hypothetical protein